MVRGLICVYEENVESEDLITDDYTIAELSDFMKEKQDYWIEYQEEAEETTLLLQPYEYVYTKSGSTTE